MNMFLLNHVQPFLCIIMYCILSVIRLVLDMIDFTKTINLPGLMFLADFEQIFDHLYSHVKNDKLHIYLA